MGLFNGNWGRSKNSLAYIRKNQPNKEKITDAIKQAIEKTPYIENYEYDFRDFGINQKLKNDMIVASVFNETNPWFDDHFKNNLLKNMTKKLSARILDNYNIYESRNDIKNIIKEFSIKVDNNVYNFSFDEKFLIKLCVNNLLYNKSYVKFNLVDGKIVLDIVEPFKIKLDKVNEISYQLYYNQNGQPSYEERTKDDIKYYTYNDKTKKWEYIRSDINPLKMLGVYDFNMEYNLINKATLENILMYTKVDTLLAKEINNGTMMIFADMGYFNEGFDPEQIGMRFVKTPENNTLDANMNTLFQVVQHDIRAEGIRNIHDLVKEKIAESLLLDKGSLGLDSTTETATATKIKNATAIDTINSLKQAFEDAFNNMLFEIFGNRDYKFYVDSYKTSDLESLLQQAQIGLVGGSMSTSRAVQLVNNDLTPEEMIKEVVLVKIENGKTLTNEEKEYAVGNNLLDKSALEF